MKEEQFDLGLVLDALLCASAILWTKSTIQLRSSNSPTTVPSIRHSTQDHSNKEQLSEIIQ